MKPAVESTIKRSTGQLLNFTPGLYLERTSRPVYALFFLLPFIIFYELGTFLLNTDLLNQTQVRVVAFVWLQRWLEYIGLSGKFVWAMPPLFVVVILLALQITSRKSWRFWFNDIWLMMGECILLAVPLIVLGLFLNSSAATQASAIPVELRLSAVAGSVAQRSVLADIVTGIGAGIYEELVFRLILICLLMMFLQDVLKVNRRTAVIVSVIISAALFSAHHHIAVVDGRIWSLGRFDFTVFMFRTIAGIYFAILFAVRGFGIAAGTHAFYDIIATLINAIFFSN